MSDHKKGLGLSGSAAAANTRIIRNPRREGEPPTLTLSVTDLSRSGSGVARDEGGRVVFIPFTAPGDRVVVRIVSSDKRYAEAELLEILEASPVRQKPPCPIFGKCGGCQWQHLPYDLQWQTKVRGVRHGLDRVKVAPPQDWTEFPAERIWEYRNRIQLRGIQEKMGFFAPRSHELIPVDRCAIARPEINAAWEETRAQARELPQDRQFKVEVEVLPSGGLRRMWNAPHGAAGFRQIHDEQNEKMRHWVKSVLTPGRELFDLFGGSGNLSLHLADSMEKIHCVDLSSPEGKTEGVPANFKYYRAPALDWVLRKQRGGAFASSKTQRSAILDPPRIGLGPDFNRIEAGLREFGVNELVAVGCDPDNWARDVSRFVGRGWVLEKAAILDFFPQTPHVESIAFLRYP